MQTVVSSHISELDKDMARTVILLASSEMTKVKVRRRQPSPLTGLPTPVCEDVGSCLLPRGCLSILPSDCPPGRGGPPVISEVEMEAEKIPDLSG